MAKKYWLLEQEWAGNISIGLGLGGLVGLVFFTVSSLSGPVAGIEFSLGTMPHPLRYLAFLFGIPCLFFMLVGFAISFELRGVGGREK